MTPARKHPATVADIPALKLCTSCGVCQGICPSRAITMKIVPGGTWAPLIDESLCTDCGLCRQSCAGSGFDFPGMQHKLFGGAPEHPEIGNTLEMFSGHCADSDLHWKAQSGGIVSTLLLHLLETKAISGALLVRWNPSKPMEAEPFIARTREDVIQATGSKYCPVPTGKLMATVLQEEGRFAVVGPSCLIQSLRKAEVAIPALSAKIHIRIGLACLNVFALPFHEYLRHRLKLKPDEIRSFEHRSKAWRGWPGTLRIRTHTGNDLDLPAQESRVIPRPFFSPWRCNLCIDKANEFADITCGDCRVARHYGINNLSHLGHAHPGLSDIIVRTEAGRKTLHNAIDAGLIHAEPSSSEEITDSVRPATKKLGFEPFSAQARRNGLGVPAYGIRYLPSTPEAQALRQSLKHRTGKASSFYIWTSSLMRHPWYPRFLARLPPALLRAINRYVHQNSWHEQLGKCQLETITETP